MPIQYKHPQKDGNFGDLDERQRRNKIGKTIFSETKKSIADEFQPQIQVAGVELTDVSKISELLSEMQIETELLIEKVRSSEGDFSNFSFPQDIINDVSKAVKKADELENKIKDLQKNPEKIRDIGVQEINNINAKFQKLMDTYGDFVDVFEPSFTDIKETFSIGQEEIRKLEETFLEASLEKLNFENELAGMELFFGEELLLPEDQREFNRTEDQMNKELRAQELEILRAGLREDNAEEDLREREALLKLEETPSKGVDSIFNILINKLAPKLEKLEIFFDSTFQGPSQTITSGTQSIPRRFQ